MKACKFCDYETDQLFALFEKGEKEYCSECQMEAENEIQENEHYEYDRGLGSAWEGY